MPVFLVGMVLLWEAAEGGGQGGGRGLLGGALRSGVKVCEPMVGKILGGMRGRLIPATVTGIMDGSW